MTLLDGLFAFLGAALGAALAYVGTRSATRAEREARRREEWGRRFGVALEAVTSADANRRAVGRALLVELVRSQLATDDDRSEAKAVLDAAATQGAGRDLRLVLPSRSLDDVEIARDNRQDEDVGGGDR